MDTGFFDNIDFSDFFTFDERESGNIFAKNPGTENELPSGDPMGYAPGNGVGVGPDNSENRFNPAFKGNITPIIDLDALNKGFEDVQRQALGETDNSKMFLPYGIIAGDTYETQPETTGNKFNNPAVDYLVRLQKANAASGNNVSQDSFQGTAAVNPIYVQDTNQVPLPSQMMGMPVMVPGMQPIFPDGMNPLPAQKKGVKATAYDIMMDFVARVPMFTHGQKIYIYDSAGGYYKYRPQHEVEQLIMDLYRARIKESGCGALIEKVYKLLLKEPGIVRDVTPLSDPTKLSFSNCTLDLQTGTLTPHSPVYYITHALNCALARFNYQNEQCPAFDKFLHDISGGDKLLEQRIWEMIGYCLTPDVNAKVFFLLQGVPDSGKSLLCTLLSDFFPESKVSALNVHSLKEQFAMGNLDSMALCVSPDLPASALDPKSASCIKQLTGNDKISAAVKYRRNAQFRFEGKLILASNYPLLTAEPDGAFMKRAVVIPFLHAIPKAEQKGDLLDCLKTEKPAIASKALDAYFRLRKNHYNFSGNYVVNSTLLYPENYMESSEIMPLVYNFLMNYFEKDSEGLIAIESAYSLFLQEVSNQYTEKMFSSAFQRLAEELYDANRVRSYHEGLYKNARSSLKGIRFKRTHG